MVPALANAQAESAVHTPALCQQLAQEGLSEENLSQWKDAAIECQHQPQWLAKLGHHLNQLGQYRDAADHLERALMLNSQLLDAQIDYAIALAGLGDKASAMSLIEDLLQSPDLPIPLRPVLAEQHTKVGQQIPARQPPNHWQSQTQWGFVVGRDSNLMGAPNIGSLTLTLGSTTQNLPLEASYLAKPGNYYRTEINVHARRQEANAPQWDLLASLRQRGSPSQTQVGSNQYELIAERNTPQLPTDSRRNASYLRVSTAGIDTQLSGRYTVHGLSAGIKKNEVNPGSRCHWRAGAEMQVRDYADNATLSGQYQGLSFNWSCNPAMVASATSDKIQWYLFVRAGKDRAKDDDRAGGAQTQTSIQLNVQVPAQLLGKLATGQVQVSAEWAISQDSKGFNSLLDNGAIRKIEKKSAKLEYLKSIKTNQAANHLELLTGLEWVEHTSNIRLFGLRSWGPYAGFRFVW